MHDNPPPRAQNARLAIVFVEVLISVEDDGSAWTPTSSSPTCATPTKIGAHVGLGNINQRMRSAFGDEYALMLETARALG